MTRASFSKLSLFVGLSAALIAAAVPFAPDDAEAQRGMRAQVFLLQGRVPRLPSRRALLGYARRHHRSRLQEITDAPIPERRWQGQMVVKFSRPLGDLEFQVAFYDLEGGQRRFVSPAMNVMVHDRDESVFLQRFRLDRPSFEPGHRMELVVKIRNHAVGRRRFELVGERVRRSGRVDFTNDG